MVVLQPDGNCIEIQKAWDLVADFRGMERTHWKADPHRPSTSQHDPESIKTLADRLGYKINPAAASAGRTALHLAAAAGDSVACKTLIENGYSVTDVDVYGRSASAFARSSGHFELAAALEGREETPEEVIARRPLNLAELNGLVTDTRRTLERLVSGDRIVARDVKGDTALHIVAMQGNLWAADMLVRAGADLHSVNLSGMTPEQVARANGHGWLADQLRLAMGGTEVSSEVVVQEPLNERAVGQVQNEEVPYARFESEAFDEELLDSFSFDGEIEAEEFHQASGINATRGEFRRIGNDLMLQFDEAATEFDWDFNFQPRQIEGDGIKADTSPTEEEVETYAQAPHRVLRREIRPSNWNRFSIDPEACANLAESIIAKGFFCDDDIDELLGICRGRFDPEQLRLNLIHEIEAAGFDFVSEETAAPPATLTDVSSEELSDAIVATCTRSYRLPGTRDRILDGRSEKPLTDAVTLARQSLLLGIAEHVRVLDIIIYMSEQVIAGTVDCGEVTHLLVSPERRSGETEQFAEAVDALRRLRSRIESGSGSAVRQASKLLAELELRQDFLKSVIAEMGGADELASFAVPLSRAVVALEECTSVLVLASLPRCRRHAAQRTGDDEDQEDVFQASFLGLQRAVATFDPSRSNFSTYSSIWMMQALSRWRSTETRLIRLPVHLDQELRKLLRADEWTDPSLSTEERVMALSSTLETTVEKVRKLGGLPQWAVDLSEIDQCSSNAFLDHVLDTLHNKTLSGVIRKMFLSLEPRQERVLRLRYGFGSGEEKTLEEVGQIFNVTRERIRQIEMRGIERLRHPVRLGMLHKVYRP